MTIIDTVRRDADVWTAMDRWPRLIDALLKRNDMLEARGQHRSGLAKLLSELADRGRLTDKDEGEILASIAQHTKVRLAREVVRASS